MCDMLYMKLKNEKDLRASVLASGVNNALTRMLLERVDREITLIEDRINGEGNKERAQRGVTVGFMANVFKALHRRRDIKNRGDNTIFTVSQSTEQQMQAVTQ